MLRDARERQDDDVRAAGVAFALECRRRRADGTRGGGQRQDALLERFLAAGSGDMDAADRPHLWLQRGREVLFSSPPPPADFEGLREEVAVLERHRTTVLECAIGGRVPAEGSRLSAAASRLGLAHALNAERRGFTLLEVLAAERDVDGLRFLLAGARLSGRGGGGGGGGAAGEHRLRCGRLGLGLGLGQPLLQRPDGAFRRLLQICLCSCGVFTGDALLHSRQCRPSARALAAVLQSCYGACVEAKLQSLAALVFCITAPAGATTAEQPGKNGSAAEVGSSGGALLPVSAIQAIAQHRWSSLRRECAAELAQAVAATSGEANAFEVPVQVDVVTRDFPEGTDNAVEQSCPVDSELEQQTVSTAISPVRASTRKPLLHTTCESMDVPSVQLLLIAGVDTDLIWEGAAAFDRAGFARFIPQFPCGTGAAMARGRSKSMVLRWIEQLRAAGDDMDHHRTGRPRGEELDCAADSFRIQ